MTTTNQTRRRDRILEAIARDALNIPTLHRRNRDDSDFHEVAAWAVMYALRQAYSAGYEQAVTDREPGNALDDANLVKAAFACPNCGQRDADRLLCDEDGEHVDCQACGTRYRIEHGSDQASTTDD